MSDIQNQFSWSKSRHGLFAECRRGYWLHYYGSWGGWDAAAPQEVRERYLLKTLSTRQQWAGKVVHDVIQEALQRIQRGNPAAGAEELVESAHAVMRKQFRDSRDGLYRKKNPKKYPGLVEHELNLPVENGEWLANWENARRSLLNFVSMGWQVTAAAIPRNRWLPVDSLDTFCLEGTTVYAAPDFAFFDGGRLVIVDWKTGSFREADEKQVQCYVLFAESHWNIPREKIVARLVYLGSGSSVDVAADDAALEEFMVHFRKSVEAMKACLSDPEKNIAGDASDFPMTKEISRCYSCRFRRLCGR